MLALSSTDRHERPRVLVLDDAASMAEMVAEGLSERGYDATHMSSSRGAVKLLETGEPNFDAVVTDLRMPELDGFEVLSVAKRTDPYRPVIVMTAYSALDAALESIRRGAYHYLTKPFKADELALFLGRGIDEARLRTETRSLRRALRDGASLANFVGKSTPMRELRDLVTRVSEMEAPVLVVGEMGTGKGTVARAIHAVGPRAGAPFVGINCAALTESLLEGELFGRPGGRSRERAGLLAEAAGGVLFLDEIGNVSPAIQARLLRVLETRAFDGRIVASTHRDLRARVAAGAFREDLLSRLEVVTVELPPLRHRRGDLPELLAHFLARERRKHPGSCVEAFAPDALDVLLEYQWPGNVGELELVVERAVVLSRSPRVEVSDLPSRVRVRRHPPPPPFSGPVLSIQELQRRYATWALEQLEGRRALAAEKLGVDDETLARWLVEEGRDVAVT